MNVDLDDFLDALTGSGVTVGEYLACLLAGVWRDEATTEYGLTGNSDWRYDIYEVLRDLGAIPAWEPGHGLEPITQRQADVFITAAIHYRMHWNT